MLGTGFIHPLPACWLVCVTPTYNNSNTDAAHPSSPEVLWKKRIISVPRVSHGRKDMIPDKQERKESLFEWSEIGFAAEIKGRSGSKSSSLTCDVTRAAFRLCRRCTARSGGWEGIFTASRTPGCWVLFGAEQTSACCCFQIGGSQWVNGQAAG